MKRRIATIAAMLLLAVSLTAGSFGSNAGSAAAQGAVHEADGTWHKVAGDGNVRFNVMWNGNVNVRWSNRFGLVTETQGEGEDQTTVEKFPHDYWVRITAEGLATARYVNPGDEGEGGWSTRFRNFEIGKDYSLIIQPRDADGDPQGDPVSFVIKPRHVSPPKPPRNLAVTASDNGQGVTVRWDAPEKGNGGKPKHYVVVITNTTTGQVIADNVPVGSPRKDFMPKAWDRVKVKFDGLWPGDSYRVGVVTYARNSRYDSSKDLASDRFQSSTFAVSNVTMPAGATPSYTKKTPTPVLELVAAGDPAPPWVIGTPTAYVVDTGDSYERFDAPGRCANWQNSHSFFRYSDAEAWKAIKEAQKQNNYFLKPAQDELQKAKQQLQKAKDDNAAEAVILQNQVAVDDAQRRVDAAQAILDERVATVATECARAYPVVENLTDDDRRWYDASSRHDWDWR